jgi:hypothetical protein
MHLIEVAPFPCTVCGRGNVPRNDGGKNVFVDLERDVNWNEPVILCEDCAIAVGSIVGMLTTTDKQDLDKVIEKRDKTIHELQADNDALRRTAVNRKKKAPAVAA